MSDRPGSDGPKKAERPDRSIGLEFPSSELLIRANTLIRLIDRQRVDHATAPTVLTQVDRQPLLDAGFTAKEIEEATRDQHTWERLALREFGRIGRDPGRISPHLARLGDAWKRHPTWRFVQLVVDVASTPPPGASLFAMEEPAFLERLEEWDAVRAGRSGAVEPVGGQRSEWIDRFLAAFLRCWASDADTRFGQMVVNIGRLGRRGKDLGGITDEEFLELLGVG